MSQQHKALFLLTQDDTKFTLGTRPTPNPGFGEVLVKNAAAALNPVDAWVEKYPDFAKIIRPNGKYPLVAGMDGAGVIHQLGEGVSGWQVGDRVAYQSGVENDSHTFQEYSLTPAARMVKIPSNISFEQAATLPLGLATAATIPYSDGESAGLIAPWEANGRNYYVGQPILITGGASSVGQFALQLAKLSGFSPIITTSSGRNAEYCRAAGATHVIDYKETPYEQLPEAVSKITTEPFHFIFDVTPSQETQSACWKILAPGGTLGVSHFPNTVGKVDEDNTGKRRVFTIAQINNGPHMEFATRMYTALPRLLETGELKLNRVEVLPGGLTGISDGLDRLFKGSVSGVKLVARLDA